MHTRSTNLFIDATNIFRDMKEYTSDQSWIQCLNVSYSGLQIAVFKALVQWLKILYSVQTCRNCVFQISMFILKYSGFPVQWLTSSNSCSSLVPTVVDGGFNISGWRPVRWLESNMYLIRTKIAYTMQGNFCILYTG